MGRTDTSADVVPAFGCAYRFRSSPARHAHGPAVADDEGDSDDVRVFNVRRGVTSRICFSSPVGGSAAAMY